MDPRRRPNRSAFVPSRLLLLVRIPAIRSFATWPRLLGKRFRLKVCPSIPVTAQPFEIDNRHPTVLKS
jgi:hypothetical protein